MTVLDPDTKPYDKIIKRNIDELLDKFDQIVKSITVTIVEKNIDQEPASNDESVATAA